MTQRVIEEFESLYFKSILPHSLGSVVMFHGYGADAQNLAPLRHILDPKQQWNWYFPNGPFKIAFSPTMEGRGWFPLNMMELQMAYFAQKLDYFETGKPYGMFETLARLQKFYTTVLAETESKLLNVGGFSQGSMLALFSSLEPEVYTRLKNLFLYSSSLVSTDELYKKIGSLQDFSNVNILQSHGRSDPVLPFSQAVKLSEILKNRFTKFYFESFNGGHEISDSILEKSRQQLELLTK